MGKLSENKGLRYDHQPAASQALQLRHSSHHLLTQEVTNLNRLARGHAGGDGFVSSRVLPNPLEEDQFRIQM